MASSTKILKEGQKQADKLYKNMYNTALSALTSYGGELQAAQPTVESDIQKAYQGMRQTAQTAKETAMGTIGSQREAATRASESAIAEARRVASEQMQGLQARYGTATGTGGFTGELLGRETARNIATERGNLAGQMGQLDLATRQIESESANKMYEIDTAANKAINDARSSLRDQLAQINFKKGELEADKAAKRIGAIQSYTQAIANIQAQKEAEKRAIEGQKNMALFNLDIWKQQNAITNAQNIVPTAKTPSLSDIIKTTTAYNKMMNYKGTPAGMGLNEYYGLIQSGQNIPSSYFSKGGSSMDLGTANTGVFSSDNPYK